MGIAREQMGYMAHASLLYDELTGMENLRYFAQLYGMDADADRSISARDVALRWLRRSRRRCAIIRRACGSGCHWRGRMVHSPQVILLDEPFSNVDAASASQMTALLSKLRTAGCTIVIVTHQTQHRERYWRRVHHASAAGK